MHARTRECRMGEDNSGSEIVSCETGQIETDSTLSERQRILHGDFIRSATFLVAYDDLSDLKVAINDGQLAQLPRTKDIPGAEVWKHQRRQYDWLCRIPRFR